MSEEINYDRRRFFGTAAMTIVAARMPSSAVPRKKRHERSCALP